MRDSCTDSACWHLVPNMRCLLSIGRAGYLPSPQQRELPKEGRR